MQYYVDILASGAVVGPGPLTEIIEWTVTKRIDRAGAFSFTLPASADAAELVQIKRSCNIYAHMGSGYTYVGGGIIDSVEHTIAADGTVLLKVAGDDNLRELTYRTVGALGISATEISYLWPQRSTMGSATAVRCCIRAYAGVLIAGGNDGHVYTSSDDGATWTDRGQLGSDTDTVHVWQYTYYAWPTTSTYTYIATTAGNTYYSSNNGATWAANNTWAADVAPMRSGVGSGGDPYYFIIAIDANVYRSANYFIDLGFWTDIGALGSETSATASAAVSSTVQLFGTSPNGRIFRTTDGGVNWTDIGRLGTETSVPALGVNGTTVLAGTAPSGKIYRSTNSGSSWTNVATLASSSTVTALLYVGSSTWYAGTGANGKIYRSTDDGVNWTEVGDLTEAQISALLSADTILATGTSSNKAYAMETTYTEIPADHADAVAALEDLAPAGWTFTADATPGNDEILIQFAGESLLNAALLLAQRSATHCYLSASKTLTYIDTWTSSGVHLVALDNGAVPDATVGVIIGLTKTEQAYDVVTRIYPYGRDANGARLGIATRTVIDPTGTTVDTGNNYVQHTAGYASYGLIERWIDYDDIRAVGTDNAAAANALVLAAANDLTRLAAVRTNYNITLGGLSVLLSPMTTVPVWWQGDGLSIDETLDILEATWRGDANGMTTVGIVASPSPYWIEDDAEIVSASMARVARLAAR
jgi:photosystem II stability/assembly factor-like uncharacterized protein